MGLVIDAKVGLVVASRVTVPFDLCNVSITIAENIVVDGRVVFLHPQQNYSIIQYDPTLVDAPVQSAKLSTKVARQGADVIFVGVDPLDDRLHLANTKITGVSTYICQPDYNSPGYRCEHVDAITVDTHLAASCPSGVLLSSDGIVEALWLKFLSADNDERSSGLGTSVLFPVINEIRRGKIPGLRILDLTTESISMSVARSLGLGERWVSQVMVENPSMHQLFMVSKTDAMLVRELTQWNEENRPYLHNGDVILTLNRRLITQNSDFDVMYNELYLDVLVLRNGNEVHLRYPTVSVQETSRAVIFGGAQLQAPHRAVKQVFSRLHSEIYISNIIQSGSPADFFGLQSNTFITAVNEKETETLDDFLREASKIPGDNYFTVRIVDIKNIQSSVTMRKNDHYFPMMEYIKTGLSRWKLITYGEQGRIIDETDVINDIVATNTDADEITCDVYLEQRAELCELPRACDSTANPTFTQIQSVTAIIFSLL